MLGPRADGGTCRAAPVAGAERTRQPGPIGPGSTPAVTPGAVAVRVVELLAGIGVALVVAWLALAILLLVARRGTVGPTAILRLLPDLLRLLHGLATDRAVPAGAKLWLWLLLAYLASPIDLVPDFLPVIGYADGAILVAAVLRAVVRRSGMAAVRRNWPGSEEGLAAVARAARLPDADG